MSTTESEVRDDIVRLSHSLYERDFSVGSAGNISAAVDDGVLITPTNSCLGFLDPERISKISHDGRHLSGDRPSKEVFLHKAFYETAPACELKQRCCPNAVARKVPRDRNKDAHDVARAIADTPDYERSRHRRKKVEMLFAHLKRILRMARLRLRGPCGARDEFLLAATAQNLRRLAKLRPSRLPAAMTA
jgi:hypothetical protein